MDRIPTIGQDQRRHRELGRRPQGPRPTTNRSRRACR
jgi:hypothetical protein